MTIDKQQLISLLEEKTDLQREQVKDQLSELVSRIREAAEEGKTFEIEEFGTFSMEGGNLQFEPADILQTEINNKYAGMKPIELIGAFKEPEGDEIPDITEGRDGLKEKAWAFDKDAAGQTPSEEIRQEEEEEKEVERPAAETGDVIEKETPSAEEIYQKVFEGTGETTEASEESQEVVTNEQTDPENKETTEPEKVLADDAEQEDPIGKFLIAAVIVIAVLVGGWLIYDMGIVSNSTGDAGAQQATAGAVNQPSQVASQQDNQQQAEPEEAAQETTSTAAANSQGSEPEQSNEVGNNEQPTAEQSQASESSPYGLRGEVNQSASNGYTLVVHSLRDIEKAESRKQNLKQAGFRVVISKASVDGTTYYRVGLGQFESIEAAQQAASKLPEQFRSSQHHFVKRIQQLISN